MKTNYLRLSCILFSTLTCHAIHAHNDKNTWLNTAEFVYPINVKESQNLKDQRYIAVSESLGIALLNNQGRVLSKINKKSEHLDFRFLPNETDQGVIASLDINTGHIQLIKVDLSLNKMTLALDYMPMNTSVDALCLGYTSEHINLYSVDVFGQTKQMALNTSNKSKWQLNEIRHFSVGPNMKSCAVNDVTQALHIAEENIGIWHYSTNPEHEVTRTLSQLPDELEVEYLDSTKFGDVAVVSPNTNKIWVLNHESNAFKPFKLPKNVQPKTVQLQRIDDALIAFYFDDETKKNNKIILASYPQPKNLTSSLTHHESLQPYAQTNPVSSYGDAADDPAIWINHQSPSKSLVYGTDKKSGLNVYDLEGRLIKALPIGRVNNVDIRYNVMSDGESFDLAAASNRTNKSISLFKINKLSGIPTLLADIKTDLSDPYGLCMGQYDGQLVIWINDTDGRFQKYDIEITDSSVKGNKTFEWTVPSQPEGCVSDDINNRLFYGEESTGVWLKQINEQSQGKLITGLNEHVHADIEGMSLYTLNNKHYLIVSSQGNNKYAVYAVDNNNKFLGTFKVAANWNKMIDGASETDGLAITSHKLGKTLPHGLLVVQDGHNVKPMQKQNFKLVNGTLLRNWILKKINQ